MKQYHVCNGLAKQAEAKLKHTEEVRLKVEQQANKASKKLKTLEKQREKVWHFNSLSPQPNDNSVNKLFH